MLTLFGWKCKIIRAIIVWEYRGVIIDGIHDYKKKKKKVVYIREKNTNFMR